MMPDSVVVVSIYRRNNRAKRATGFMNLRKAIEDTRGRAIAIYRPRGVSYGG